MSFQHSLFFMINEGNGLSLHLIPSCTLSCCACIKFSDGLFGGESQEKVGNEWGAAWEKDRETEDWQEALSTEWVMESSSARWQAERRFGRHRLPCSPTLSPRLITQLLLNLKCKEVGGSLLFILLSVFFLPLLSSSPRPRSGMSRNGSPASDS